VMGRTVQHFSKSNPGLNTVDRGANRDAIGEHRDNGVRAQVVKYYTPAVLIFTEEVVWRIQPCRHGQKFMSDSDRQPRRVSLISHRQQILERPSLCHHHISVMVFAFGMKGRSSFGR
jgi:hypothetical protein